MTEFTAHNIRLPDGSLTMPEAGWEIAEHPLLQAVQGLFQELFPEGCTGKTIVDLGCLEGGYTVEFARMGFSALGMEVRQSNIDNCRYVQSKVRLPNLAFAHDDVRNLSYYGPFDVVFCNGLLYHLDEPMSFLAEISKVAGRVLVLDTHYATEEPTEYFDLGELVEQGGLIGRWYTEYTTVSNPRDETKKWSSWGNRSSFWPLKSELGRAIRECGFQTEFELLASRSAELMKQRVTLVGLK